MGSNEGSDPTKGACVTMKVMQPRKNAHLRNFTKNKLDDRINWSNGHTDEYLRILNETDEEEENRRT